MSTNNQEIKKNWNSNLDIFEIKSILDNYLNRSKSKGIVIKEDLKLYQPYILNHYWITNGYTEISQFFKFSKNDLPEMNIAREIILKLMSVCLTTHIYLRPNAQIKYEPYIFKIPSMDNLGMFDYGIVYTLEENNKTYSIIVSEWDFANCSNNKNFQPWNKFPVIQGSDLFNIDKLIKLRDMDSAKYFKINDWKSYNLYKNEISEIEDKKLFNFGKVLSFDPALKEFYSSIGCVWAKGIKSWFIPKGLDFIKIDQFLKIKKDN
jgi:hypothetical protein